MEPLKVVLVNGSPHKNGCTHRALAEVGSALAACGVESEEFWIGTKPIAGCIACRQCAKTGRCVFDDVVNEFIEKAPSYDGFVFGSPVYYAGAAGSLTCFMDRAFYAEHGGAYVMKPAAAVVSARRGGTTATWDELNKYFGINQMPIVSSQYWNMVHGNTPQEVEQDLEGLQTMRTLGRNMAYMIKAFAAAREAGIELPEPEPFQRTNFIR